MSYKGHLLCRKCKLTLCLGKLQRDGVSQNDILDHIGFAHANLTAEELGKVVLQFVAQHITHDIVAVGDPVWENIEDLVEYDLCMVTRRDGEWALEFQAMEIGGVKFYRVPCEPLEERRRRLENTNSIDDASNDQSS